MIDVDQFRVQPGQRVDLANTPTDVDGGLNEDDARDHRDDLTKELEDLQESLFAEKRRSVLFVLQAMDAGGKDSTIRSVFGPLNPQGVRVAGFKAPSSLERSHDYLWRIHDRLPPRGYIGVFNRSHYEDVLIVRVRNLVPEAQWQRRYEHINAFEQMLHDEGTTVVKFYLHISKEYQRHRFQRRLDRPGKQWKFNPDDLTERARWDEYQVAFEEALRRCSTSHAPWYIIPSETRWFRNLLITQIVARTLRDMNIQVPPLTFDPSTITIDD